MNPFSPTAPSFAPAFLHSKLSLEVSSFVCCTASTSVVKTARRLPKTLHVFASSCPNLWGLAPAPKPSCGRLSVELLALRTHSCRWRSVGRVASDVRTVLQFTQQQPRGRPTDLTRCWIQKTETHTQTAPECSGTAAKESVTRAREEEAETSRTSVICISLPINILIFINIYNYHLAQRSSPTGSLVHAPDADLSSSTAVLANRLIGTCARCRP